VARSTTLQALLDRIRSRCDSRSIRQSDLVLTDWINEAITELWEIVSNANPTWMFREFPAINIVQGTQSYVVPTDCFRVGRVDLLQDSGDWFSMTNCTFMEVEFTQASTAPRGGMRYSLVGENLYLERSPGWSQVGGLKIWGIPVPEKLTQSGQTMDFIHGWERYVVNKVIVDWSQADQRVVEAAAVLLGKAEQQILSAATRRDIGQGVRLRLVDPGGGIGGLRAKRGHPWD